jgi:diguanylate cyclase (GGDEF)-like protein/PAS domain S-box-containing protein
MELTVNQGREQIDINQTAPSGNLVLQQWRGKMLNVMLVVSILLTLPSLYLSWMEIQANPMQWLTFGLLLGTLVIYLIAVVFRKINLTLRSIAMLLGNIVMGIIFLIQTHTIGIGAELLLFLPVSATILLGVTGGLLTAICDILILAGFHVISAEKCLSAWYIDLGNYTPTTQFVFHEMELLLLLAIVFLLVAMFYLFLMRNLSRQEKTTRDLETTRLQLEETNQNLEQISESRSYELRMAVERLEKYEKHLADIISFLPDPMLVIDEEGRVQFWNQAMEELTGVQAQAVIGKGDYEHSMALYGQRRPMLIDLVLLPNPTIERGYSNFKRVGNTVYAENHFPSVNGKDYYLTGNASPLYNAEGEISGAIEIIHDVTDRVRASDAERKAHQVTEALRQTGIQLNSITSRDEVMQRMLEVLKEIIPYDLSNILIIEGDKVRPLLLHGYEKYGEEIREKVMRVSFDLSKTANLRWIWEHRQPLVIPDTAIHPDWIADKTVYSIRSWVGAPIISQDKVTAFLCLDKEEPNFYTTEHAETLAIFANQAALALEKARLFEEVQLLAITDSLTGLFNRRHFFSLAEKEFERSLRYHRPLALLMLDLDEFKQVNDRYGHLIGDQVLQTTSAIIQQSLRKVDISGRYGGEEFVILMPETDQEKALQAAERLRQTIAEFPILLSDENISVTTSIGVACCDSQDDLRLEILLNRADEALYQAKHMGRNRVCVWEQKETPPFPEKL